MLFTFICERRSETTDLEKNGGHYSCSILTRSTMKNTSSLWVVPDVAENGTECMPTMIENLRVKLQKGLLRAEQRRSYSYLFLTSVFPLAYNAYRLRSVAEFHQIKYDISEEQRVYTYLPSHHFWTVVLCLEYWGMEDRDIIDYG